MISFIIIIIITIIMIIIIIIIVIIKAVVIIIVIVIIFLDWYLTSSKCLRLVKLFYKTHGHANLHTD